MRGRVVALLGPDGSGKTTQANLLAAVTTEFLALTLAAAHFGFPLASYFYAKRMWLPRPWNVRIDLSYRPRVTIPTRNGMKPFYAVIGHCYRVGCGAP